MIGCKVQSKYYFIAAKATHLKGDNVEISSKIIVSNLVLAAYGIGPPLFILFFYKRFPLGYWKQLIYGLALIGWSIVTFSFFSGALNSLETIEMTSESLKEGVVNSVTLWVFAYPAIVMSIGANFITQFFLTWDDE
ncbi:MAG: hypothetical protein P8R04_00960 [Gammaproteobacteria bacterium]|nr:hypothetical protein [Gammaproteobacteria bacterium]